MLLRIKLWCKWLLFPGIDLNTRCRYRFLPRFFRSGSIDTLDAGCGNGALSYAAYKLGNRVLGVTFNQTEVDKARALFDLIGTDKGRLRFELCNLYDLPKVQRKFDQIICSETLEHIARDQEIVRIFYEMLKDGGVLHLCCPYALHPDHSLGRVNGPEDGGHVRDGYILESYQALLEPVGFKIVRNFGVGTPFLQKLDRAVRYLRIKWGDIGALPLFILIWPLLGFDSLNSKLPFSLYVQAVKGLPHEG